jgi:hypothetical protein
MKKNKTFEELLCPNQNKLIVSEMGNVSANILDAEMDILNCTFHFDMSVEIDTSDLQYICLDIHNLKVLKNLIIEAEDYYEEFFKDKHLEDY